MKKSLLLLSSNNCLNTNLSEVFELFGYETHIKTSAEEAFFYLHTSRVNTIILSANVGSDRGLDILKKIRSEHDSSIRVIGMTTNPQPSIEESFLQYRANAFFYLPQELKSLIDSVLFFDHPQRLNENEERRKEFRMLVGGRAILNESVSAEIQNISYEGARLLVDKPLDHIDDTLNCNIRLNTGKEIQVKARLCWKRPNASWNGSPELGICFEDIINFENNN